MHIREILKLCAGRSPSGSLDLPGGSVHREYEYLVFGGSTPGKLETVTLNVGETVRLSPLNIEVSIFETVFDNNIHKSFTDYLFKITEVYGKISIRPRLTGDRIRPRGCSYTKTVKKLLAENHVPAGKRDLIPIITDDAGVLAVHKIALGGRASPSPGDMVYKITFKECI